VLLNVDTAVQQNSVEDVTVGQRNLKYSRRDVAVIHADHGEADWQPIVDTCAVSVTTSVLSWLSWSGADFAAVIPVDWNCDPESLTKDAPGLAARAGSHNIAISRMAAFFIWITPAAR
jgi:hypothetical protein